MNLSALTAKEVMRIYHPETELEKRLFEINSELQSEAEDAKEEAELLSRDLEDSINKEDYDDLLDVVASAVRLLADGKPEDAKKILESAI